MTKRLNALLDYFRVHGGVTGEYLEFKAIFLNDEINYFISFNPFYSKTTAVSLRNKLQLIR